MRKIVALLIFISAFVLSGCIAPLSNNFTGRSLGKGKIGLDTEAVFLDKGRYGSLKFSVGLSSNLDLGIQVDYFSMGLFGKYSIINPRDNGFALASVFGCGATGNGFYTYLGPVLSFKMNVFEPYFVSRYNYVRYNEMVDPWDGSFILAGKYSYIQFTFGSILWISRKIGLNVELNTFSGAAMLTDFKAPVVAGGLKFRF